MHDVHSTTYKVLVVEYRTEHINAGGFTDKNSILDM